MANVAKALAQALGVFGQTLVSAKQEQADQELEMRIKNFYMKQAEKQAEYAAASERRAIEDQELQRAKYDEALKSDKAQREALVRAMEQLGISGTPEDMAARQAIADMTREEDQRTREANAKAERERAATNSRATNLLSAGVPDKVAWEIAQIEDSLDKGTATPELRARHAELVAEARQSSAEAEAALSAANRPPEKTTIPEGMEAELTAVLGATPEGQAKMARFREIKATPDSARTPEMWSEWGQILNTLTQEEANPITALSRQFDLNEKLLDGIAPTDGITGARQVPEDPTKRTLAERLMQQQVDLTSQFMGLGGEAPAQAAPMTPQEQGLAVTGQAAQEVERRTGREAKKLFVTLPGREPVEFNADDPNLGNLLLKDKDAKVQILDDKQQIPKQAEALSRDAAANASLFGTWLSSANRGANQVLEATGIHPLNRMITQGVTGAADAVTNPQTYKDFNRWLIGGN